MQVLVVNAGSSSLKLALIDGAGALVRSTELTVGRGGVDAARLTGALQGWPAPDAVGHRIVHGGPHLRGPVRLDAGVEAQLRALTDLAPLHQPKSLAALDAVGALLPGVPAVACFDTAFHATLPAAAATYALPKQWRERYDIRRYGFHGLSHAYASRRAAELLHRPPLGLRVVTCHLGAGASLAAVLDGRSVDTTMGFTPLDGLVMATRSGSVDPGLLLWLMEHEQLSAGGIADALEQRSGLLGLAGTGDMREVEAAADRGEPDALLALDVYTHRLAGQIAAMTAASGGLDALVFTGGVGEHSATVRARAAARLGHLGVAVDEAANRTTDGDGDSDISAAGAGAGDGAAGGDISAAGAAVRTLVITAREDLEIARETRSLLEG